LIKKKKQKQKEEEEAIITIEPARKVSFV